MTGQAYVFEGPDGVGKTGYARWFSDMSGIVFVPELGTSDLECIEAKADARRAITSSLLDQGLSLVIDRSPVSSIVYSQVYDRERPDAAWHWIEKYDPVIVYLYCDPQELVLRHQDEMHDDLALIASVYDDVVTRLSSEHRVVDIDTSTGATKRLLDEFDDEVFEPLI